jgi:glycerol kinase
LLKLLDVPAEVLPEVHPSAHLYGETEAAVLGAPIRIGGIAGDQQSALFGQACFKAGLAKNTYGTGCFMLMHTGSVFQPSQNGLVTTSAAQPTATPEFAFEGSVFIGGAVVQWLRDGLHAIQASGMVQSLAESVPDSGGVLFVPAFTGLGAPYWKPEARGAILGLTRGTTVAHIARAALESIAFQSAALLQAMARRRAGRRRRRGDGAARRRRRVRQQPADAVPGRPARHPGRAAPGRRDHRARRCVPRRPGRRRLQEPGRAVGAVAGRTPLPPDDAAGTGTRVDGELGTRGAAGRGRLRA